MEEMTIKRISRLAVVGTIGTVQAKAEAERRHYHLRQTAESPIAIIKRATAVLAAAATDAVETTVVVGVVAHEARKPIDFKLIREVLGD